MGIYGTAMHHHLGELVGAAATDENAGRQIIVNEDRLVFMDASGRHERSPERGWVSVQCPVDGYQAVGMFLSVQVIEAGGDKLTEYADKLVQRAKDRQRLGRKTFAGETVRERYVRLGEGKPGAYGSAGGSSGDHIIALREAIERGDGDKVYPASA